MKRNQEITELSNEIMLDITNNRIPLHSILLKASRLSLLLDIPKNVDLFKGWAFYAEQNLFVVETFKSNIESSKDNDVSISSSNPQQYVHSPIGNNIERSGIRTEAKKVVSYLAKYRTETYNFALGVYAKWAFGNIAESIFERKRKRIEPILQEIFADANQRLNSIEQNLISENPEDWKNAIVSCRSLFMDLADILNPAKNSADKDKYINRLKDCISPKIDSETKKDALQSLLEEIKNRIELSIQATQGSAHRDRPTREQAEDVVLQTYLAIGDILELGHKTKEEKALTEPEGV